MSDYINTKLIETLEHINREIYYFESAYNKTPVTIVVSHGLYNLITIDRNHFAYHDGSGGMIGEFAGIPIEIYPSDKLEYYLAESKFTLD